MNKSVSISLGGLSFFIEEDAFQKLQKYLKDVQASLETEEEDTAEILKDVEARIAELFKEWLGNYRQVVDIKDVDKMVGIMGTPEQYHTEAGEEEPNNFGKSKNPSESDEKGNKFYQRQMYRDMDDKMIAGVCSGLSHFFGIQPIWVRLITVLLFLSSGWLFDGLAPTVFVIYIILWIVMPKAVSTSEKLKMKGKPVNFGSIKEYVNKEEVSEQTGKIKQNISKASSGVGDFFESFFKVVVKILAILIGIVLVVMGISFIISYFVCSFSLSLTSVNSLQYINLIFDSSWQLYTMVALLGIVVIIPSLFLILIGLRLITEKKIIKTTTTAVVTVIVLWLISTIALTVISIFLVASQFGDSVEKSNKFVINHSSDTLTVVMNDYKSGSNLFYSKRFGVNIDDIKFTKDSIIKKVDRELEIKQSQDSNFYLEVKNSASGKDEYTAQKNLSRIYYKYKIDSNKLNLDAYFSMPKDSKFRNQEVELTLYVPKGKYINTRNIKKVSYKENGRIDIFKDYENHSNKVFKFTGNSLECLTCEGNHFYEDENSDESININKDGIRIKSGKDSVEVNINKQGIKIKNHGTDSL